MMDKKNSAEIKIEHLRSHSNEAEKPRSELIEEYFSFIIHTVSQSTGRYVEIENSEELSVGLMAFNEAIDRYEDGKGATFLSFARLVINSRIRDHARRTSSKHEHVSLDAMNEESLEVQGSNGQPEQGDVAMEIKLWESILGKFGFDLEELVEETPKHEDTRNNAIDLSERISDDQEIVNHMYVKYKLPITRVVVRFKTTKKIVTRSRRFIIATVVILTKNLDLLRQWIYKGRKGCSSC